MNAFKRRKKLKIEAMLARRAAAEGKKEEAPVEVEPVVEAVVAEPEPVVVEAAEPGRSALVELPPEVPAEATPVAEESPVSAPKTGKKKKFNN